MAKATSKIKIGDKKYDVKDQYLRDEIEKLQDTVKAGTGITIKDETISLTDYEGE